MKKYSKKEKKEIIGMLKRNNFQIFSWCIICDRITLHAFYSITGISNLIHCTEEHK
jgi:hypothetical protein